MKEQASASLLPPSPHIVPAERHRDTDDESQILCVHCYRTSCIRTVLYWAMSVGTLGVWFLLLWWFQSLSLRCRYARTVPEKATHFLIVTQHSADLMRAERLTSPTMGSLLLYTHRHLRYYYADNSFHPLIFDIALPCNLLRQKYERGYNEAQVLAVRELYGMCKIEPPLKSVPRLFVDEVLHPFVIFQLLSCANWIWEKYETYAYAILLITSTSLGYTLYETRKNTLKVREMALKVSYSTVLRSGRFERVNSEELVPGDVVQVPEPEQEVPCDLVLLTGSCVLKESMLTGESVPVLKEALPEVATPYDLDADKRYSLYQGTIVMQSRGVGDMKPLAVATRTGFMTLKGKLIRSILYPKPSKFKFYEDALRFIAVLAVLAVLGFMVTIQAQLAVGMNLINLLQRSFDLMTEAVPPALPAAMAVGTNIAIYRLLDRKIYCTSPPRVNVCGNITQVCFDKTGTLTEDGMALLGVVPAINRSFLPLTSDFKGLPEAANPFIESLVCCQSLSVVNGQLLGDAMDLVLFAATGWHYDQPPADSAFKCILCNPQPIYAVLRIFHFSSRHKHMGVVVEHLSDQSLHLFVKGAPEVIISMCVKHTVPGNFSDEQATYTRAGYRVLACAATALPSLDRNALFCLSLEDLEVNLQFLGMVVLQNQLKTQSAETIAQLHRANIKTLMATGDAVLTGITVARDCGMINGSDDVYLGEIVGGRLKWEIYSLSLNRSNFLDKSLVEQGSKDAPWLQLLIDQPDFSVALTGQAFQFLVKEAETSRKASLLLKACIEKAKVYGRMSPELKSLLVEKLQGLGHLVLMCGDGANDCGALKAADVGISLSEAEASIAAPFTSKIQDVSCVLTALKEGRCALSTSLQAFKFMAIYAIIQVLSVTVLYMWGSNLSPNQFLSEDLFLVLPLALFMSLSGPCDNLSKEQPPSALISWPILSSVFGQGGLALGGIILAWYIISLQDFFTPVQASGDTPADMIAAYTCYENTAIYLFSFYTYLGICWVYNVGRPFKLPAYTNPWFMLISLIELAWIVGMIIHPGTFLSSLFNVFLT